MANQSLQQPGYQLLGSRLTKGKKKGARPKKAGGRTLTSWQAVLVTGTELTGFLFSAFILIVTVLGRVSARFAGSGLWSSLIPFVASILAVAIGAAIAFAVWLPLRSWLMSRVSILPATVSLLSAYAAYRFTQQDEFVAEVGNLRALVGGSAEAERNTIAHQVFAAYRRSDLAGTQRILDRARVFEPTIFEAARIFEVDPEILVGLGATESSFYPRDSKDGGRGIFQITSPPQAATQRALKELGVGELDPLNQRHNAFVAAATLHHYLAEMHDDLFLGLLAYNIGPKNGGLRSIMQQYGARDFVTIQPYLQNLPRDYPIRVLSAALAFRLWRIEGKLSRYEEGSNAMHIQRVGIPGLQPLPKDQAVLLDANH